MSTDAHDLLMISFYALSTKHTLQLSPEQISIVGNLLWSWYIHCWEAVQCINIG